MRFVIAILGFHFSLVVFSDHRPELKAKKIGNEFKIQIPQGWQEIPAEIVWSNSITFLKVVSSNPGDYKAVSCYYRVSNGANLLVIKPKASL